MKATKKAKPPTSYEREVLAAFLEEFRRAVRWRGQVSVGMTYRYESAGGGLCAVSISAWNPSACPAKIARKKGPRA